MKVQDSEEVGLKFNIQKTKIMASGLITSWRMDGETMELLEIKGNKNEMTDFNLWTPKSLWMMTAAMKLRHLLLGRNAMTNLDSTLLCRQRTSTQSYGFSSSHVWMWELDYKESWVPKNWCFWTADLEKTLASPWAARRSNQPILKKISPGCSLEGLMLQLKLQYFGHLMRRANSSEKTLMLGKIEGGRRG